MIDKPIKRKPIIVNWLNSIILLSILTICILHQVFHESCPKVSAPTIYTGYFSPHDEPSVYSSALYLKGSEQVTVTPSPSASRSKEMGNDMWVRQFGDVMYVPYSYKGLSDEELKEIIKYEDRKTELENITEQLESKSVGLETKIEQLKLTEKSYMENIEKLQSENSLFSKINEEYQKKIIEFVDRGKAKNILLSAVVGAMVSVCLTFILNIPAVKKKIIDYLFETIKEFKESKEN